MTDEKKLELLAEILECDVEDISADKVLADMEEWNSMAMLSLIVMMDDECGKTLTSGEIGKFKTVGDIMDFMD